MGSCSPSTSVRLVIRPGAKTEIEILREKIEKDLDNGDLMNTLGKALFKLENYKEAEYYLCKAVNLRKFDFDTFFLLGLINENDGIKQQAINYYLKAYEIDKYNFDNLRKISEYYLFEYNFIKSKHYLEKCLAIKPNDLEIKNLVGLCLINTGDYNEAINLLEGSTLKEKEDTIYLYKIYNILGTAYRNTKDYDRATHYYLLASKNENRMISNIALFNIGNLYLEIGEFINGMYFIEQVIEAYEISDHVLNKGINFFYSHPQIKEAITEYSLNRKNNCIIKLKEIYKGEENNIVVNFFIANSYFFIKKYEKAKCFYHKIIILNKKQNLDNKNILRKMVIKSEYILKTINSNKLDLVTSKDLDNLNENKKFEEIEINNSGFNEELKSSYFIDTNKINFVDNNHYINTLCDYTDVEILDSRNSVKKKTFEKIKMKFISDLNK